MYISPLSIKRNIICERNPRLLFPFCKEHLLKMPNDMMRFAKFIIAHACQYKGQHKKLHQLVTFDNWQRPHISKDLAIVGNDTTQKPSNDSLASAMRIS